jgi:dCMP deaminase
MIIGLTGKNASGKGEAAKFLQERGFQYASLSDVLRDELRKRKMPLTRDNLTKVGNALREKNPSILADRVLRGLSEHHNYVVDSFRNPSEVEAFRHRPDFILWAVIASPQVRFQRMKTRAREKDPRTLAAFLEVEKREASNANPAMQSIESCEKMANVRVANNATIESFYSRLTPLLKSALQQLRRPSWDAYFMNIAQVVASRSNCLKRKVAAVIVKDGRIISTGYNGTPRNTKNCFENGCPRCSRVGPSGKDLRECYCSHGEENAIVQSAYHGIGIKGSTLYTTFSPCLLCTKMIINAGIVEVVYNQEYPLAESARMLMKEAGVTLRKVLL